MLLNRLLERVSILIAAIHRYLNMHACMEVTERYHYHYQRYNFSVDS